MVSSLILAMLLQLTETGWSAIEQVTDAMAPSLLQTHSFG
jgi:hypothetical protein